MFQHLDNLLVIIESKKKASPSVYANANVAANTENVVNTHPFAYSSECSEAGQPVAHECVRDKGPAGQGPN